MVGTVGAARRLAGRTALAGTGAAFAAGLAAGGGLTFGGLGLVAAGLHPGRAWIAGAAGLAAAAAASDALGLRVRPQIPFQVPERWRRTLPLPLAVFLYGLLLGTGLTTYVPAAAAWALMVLTLALGSLASALAIGLSLAAGRALPVLALAALGDGALGLVAERPGAMRVVRLLAAGSLAVGVAAVLVGPGAAATIVAAPAGDPSVAAADLAWQQPGVGGFLSRGGQTAQLPGNDPAIGGSLVAWHVAHFVTVAARDGTAPVLQESVPGLQKLAVSDAWLAYRIGRADGGQRLVAQSLLDPPRVEEVASAGWPAQLGRPALAGDLVVFHVATGHSSWISAVDLSTGTRRRLRSSDSAQLLNPSLMGSHLLYVRASRCSQQLRLGALAGGPERVLLTLPPLAGADSGHEHGHTSEGAVTPCPGRLRPTTTVLWTTALTSRFAYVTTLRQTGGGRTTPTLLRVAH